MVIARRRFLAGLAAAAALIAVAGAGAAGAPPTYITVASTTSTEQSGLFRHLLPRFKKATGIEVRVVAVGTGQALDIGRRGDADVVFVHDPEAERRFVEEGHGVHHRPVMYNDFVLIGPASDPAKIGGSGDVLEALRRIAAARAPFVSRGDKSGTHAAERRYWRAAGVDIAAVKGSWYKETGSGMGPALNTASSLGAYLIADRGTWLSFKNRGELVVLVEGDRRLFNQYGVMLVNPQKHPHVKAEFGRLFIRWLVSPEGQRAIADFAIEGQPLFFPNAGGG